jgi:hypothetical protein
MNSSFNSQKWYHSVWLKRIGLGFLSLYFIGSVCMAVLMYVHESDFYVRQKPSTIMTFTNKKLDSTTTITFQHSDMCPIDTIPPNVPPSKPNCTLKCGNCGGCTINSRDNTEICACSKFFGTFPLYCEPNSRKCENVFAEGKNTTICSCKHGETTSYFYPCGYKLQDRVGIFLASFFGGLVGADWFLLYRGGNSGYIVAGVFKLLTGGGLTFWALADWIRIAASETNFADGNNFPLAPWP